MQVSTAANRLELAHATEVVGRYYKSAGIGVTPVLSTRDLVSQHSNYAHANRSMAHASK
jgi:ferredoxin-NADP reductase